MFFFFRMMLFSHRDGISRGFPHLYRFKIVKLLLFITKDVILGNLEFIRTSGNNTDFHLLVEKLDQYLLGINGDNNSFFAAYNTLTEIRNVIVVYVEGMPVGCGAFKKFSDDTVEIKRMFVLPEYRGKGLAATIVKELENWALELGYAFCVLETATTMQPAVKLYQKSGYSIIPNYGQYIGVESSVCMQKGINP